MSAPQFTPGPWREGIDGNNRVYGPDCAGEHTGLIAVVYKGRANISLIAAAPELYEALADALPALEALALEEARRNAVVPESLRKITADRRWTKARRALAKVRSE